MEEKKGSWLKRELDKLAPMSWGKRWEYIWEYYHIEIIGVVVVLILAIYGVQGFLDQSREVLISGVFVDNTTSPEGYDYLNNGYWEFCGADKKARVSLLESRGLNLDADIDNMNGDQIVSVDTMLSVGAIDYIIGTSAAVQFYEDREALLDLAEIFSPEELARWNTISTPTGIKAIDLTGTKLEQEFGLYAKPSYLMLIITTQSREKCARFVNYVMGE